MPATLQLPPREEVALPQQLRAAVAAALDVDELREPPGVGPGDDKAAAVADAARKAWSSLAFRRGLRDFLNGVVSLQQRCTAAGWLAFGWLCYRTGNTLLAVAAA
jgi:hypothetical protein